MELPVRFNTTFPVFVSVTGWDVEVAPTAVFAMLKAFTERDAFVCNPIPLMVTAFTPASVVNVKEPVDAPRTVGLKVTLAVQLAPAAKLVEQVVEFANAPLVPTDDMLSALLPVLVNVTD